MQAARKEKKEKIALFEDNKASFRYHFLPSTVFFIFFLFQLNWSNFESWLDSIFFNLPFALVATFLFIKKGLPFLVVFIAQIIQLINIQVTDRLIAFVGPPGAGKSVMASYQSNRLSKIQENRLNDKYNVGTSLYNRMLRNNDILGIDDYAEVRSAKTFYLINDNAIPCYASNLPIEKTVNDEKKYCLKIDIEHVEQVFRLPSYCVCLFDEVDLEQGSNTSKGIEPLVQAFYKLPRHLGEWVFRFTAQNPIKMGDYIRGVLDYLIYCQKQDWVMRPFLLEIIYFFKKIKYDNNCAKHIYDEKATLKLLKLNRLIRSIGYRRIKYKKQNNTELNSKSDALAGCFSKYYFIPSKTNWKYSDRAWRDTYACKDELINCKAFNRLYLDEKDLQFTFLKNKKGVKDNAKT